MFIIIYLILQIHFKSFALHIILSFALLGKILNILILF